jgi:tetratricopeptide (TPR) repeat protein
MKRFALYFSVAVLILFVACSGPKKVTTSVISDKELAEQAELSGNHEKALELWTLHFTKTPVEQVAGGDFAKAAQVAFKAGNITQSVSWFDQARYKNFASAEMYLTLAEIYKGQQNISKELTALEYIQTNYPEKSGVINTRLFEIYNEIKEPEKALNAWKNMSQTEQSGLQLLNQYFELQKNLKDTLVCDSVAIVLLEKDPKNVSALEWNAFKYYWKGENRYQREMEKYNKNKTNKQYKILLEELDKSTADFKKSLGFLERLWSIEPGKKYAGYFANIYARFGDENKAKYYEGLTK